MHKISAVAEHYDKLIDENNDPFRDPPALREHMDKWDGEEFIKLLQLGKTKSCLEIGVGTGRLAARTAPLCGNFFGIDISEKTVIRGNENLKDFDNVTLICANFLEYDFDRKFDVIYSSLTFMHFKDKASAFAKVKALLSPFGRFVLSTDKNQSPYIDTDFSTIKVFPDTQESVQMYANSAGFIISEQSETEFANVFVFNC